MPRTIYIWDLPLRLFHWLLVAVLVSAYVTGTQGGLWLEWHARFGLLTLCLIVFRIVWGFWGSTYARFRTFNPSFVRLKKFFCNQWRGLGHNPLGAISIYIMLSITLMQASTGLFASENEIEYYGPLNALVNSKWSERLTAWHIQLQNVLILTIATHLSAIGYYVFIKRRNLILPMLTGKSRIEEHNFVRPINGGSTVQFVFAVAAACLVFWSITNKFWILR